MSWLSELKNRHVGETAILVCNGPSLNDTDLSILKHKTVIGLNKIYLGFRKYRFYPKYYVAVNEKVLKQSQNEIKELTCTKFLSNRLDGVFEGNFNTHIINTSTPQGKFCEDISLGMEEGWTVTYAALQVAYYLGFSKVIIIGMDHRFEFSGNPNESKILSGEDPNHFCSDYFGGGQEWDNPDLKNSERSYLLARKTFEKSGREILDATVNGECDIFVKTSLEKEFVLDKGV